MSNQEDSLPEVGKKPVETEGVGGDSSLDQTQFFSDDSSPSAPSNPSDSTGKSTPGNQFPQSAGKGQQKTVGGYRLVKMLGEGGMGRVFQACDESGRMVAIKLLSPELSRSPEALDRFKQEGVIASAISHPHCVFVHRADEDNGTPFIAMELMTGQTLKDIVAKRGPLPFAEAVSLVLQCIDGLIEAHSRGMIHRDVKPANCYLDEHGNVKIGDFGLARSLVSDSELTRTGAFLGTPLYASPEQILGETVDEQSDIYSLAATLYFLLAGKAPFESPNAPQVIAKIVSADPPVFSEAGVEVPKQLEKVVLKGLARDRSKRFTSFQSFRDELVESVEQRERIATLPRRALAFLVDSFFVSLAIILAVIASFAFGELLSDFKYFVSPLGTIWQALYFFVSEAIFGTTIGKRLLNLRVVDSETSARPSLRNCAIRTFLFIILMNAIELISSVALNWYEMTPINAPVLHSLSSWLGFFVGCVAIFATWKHTQKKALLHEWVSHTQTWVASQRSGTNTIELTPPIWQLPVTPVPSQWGIPSRLGRFEIAGVISTSDDSNWLFAHDLTIERDVWIQLNSASCPPPSESREKCVRRTRMRFLETGIYEDWRWDAYVAPDGAPIRLWFNYRKPMPWPVTKQVFQDVIDELQFTTDNRTHLSTSISRWWLTASGKLTLADMPVQADGKNVSSDESGESLFKELAQLALPDRKASTFEQSRPAKPNASEEISAVPPWRATQLLQSLKTKRQFAPSQLAAELDKISQGPQVVNVTMRVVHGTILALLTSVPWLVAIVALMIPVIVDIVEEQKSVQSLVTLASVLRHPVEHQDLLSRLDEPTRSKYLEESTIVRIEQTAEQRFNHFRKAYENIGFMERTTLEKQNEIRGRGEFLERPKPDMSIVKHVKEEAGTEEGRESEEEKQEELKSRIPKIRVGPLPEDRQGNIKITDPPETLRSMISQFEAYESSSASKPWFNRTMSIIAVPLCICVVWGGLWRGGVTHLLTGLAVVRRDGRRAGVLRCGWRSLLFWLPLFATAAIIIAVDSQGSSGAWWTQQFRRLFLILPLLYLVAVIRWPNRGPHDLVSGTYVVPR